MNLPRGGGWGCLWLSVGNCVVFYLIGLLRLISPEQRGGFGANSSSSETNRNDQQNFSPPLNWYINGNKIPWLLLIPVSLCYANYYCWKSGGGISCHFVPLRSFVWSISFISNNYPIYLIERPDIADALAQKYLYFIIMTMTPSTAFLVLSIPPAVQRKSILNQLLLSISEFCYPHIHPPLWHSLTKSIFHYPPSGGE